MHYVSFFQAYEFDYGVFIETMFDAMDEDTAIEILDTGFDDSDVGIRWFGKLFDRRKYFDINEDGIRTEYGDMTPEAASKIYARAFRIYFKT